MSSGLFDCRQVFAPVRSGIRQAASAKSRPTGSRQKHEMLDILATRLVLTALCPGTAAPPENISFCSRSGWDGRRVSSIAQNKLLLLFAFRQNPSLQSLHSVPAVSTPMKWRHVGTRRPATSRREPRAARVRQRLSQQRLGMTVVSGRWMLLAVQIVEFSSPACASPLWSRETAD